MPKREERQKRRRAPKELRSAKKRTRALMKGALEAFNKRAKRVAQDRREARSTIQKMIADEKTKERQWRKEQQRQADESGVLAGALQGGMTGASVGSMFKPGIGTAIGAGVGALGGALLGSGKGGMADVAAASPYAAGISSLAQQYTATQQGKERFNQMLDLYKNRGAGQAGGARQLPHPVFGRGAGDTGGGVDGLHPFTGKPFDPKALTERYATANPAIRRDYVSPVGSRRVGDAASRTSAQYGGTTEMFNRATRPANMPQNPYVDESSVGDADWLLQHYLGKFGKAG